MAPGFLVLLLRLLPLLPDTIVALGGLRSSSAEAFLPAVALIGVILLPWGFLALLGFLTIAGWLILLRVEFARSLLVTMLGLGVVAALLAFPVANAELGLTRAEHISRASGIATAALITAILLGSPAVQRYFDYGGRGLGRR